MLDMVRKSTWIVLPYDLVRHIPHLRISPIGVVPQQERRPRTIVDYTFNGVNDETVRLTPREAMQFGRALERIIRDVVYADPKYGPIRFMKLDIADGFYRVLLNVRDIPKLGVAFPNLPHEPPLVAFPLALPMGWAESPPYFCAVTETIADETNRRLLRSHITPPHRLDNMANTYSIPVPSPSGPPATTLPVPTQRNPLLPPNRRILGKVDVFVDDFIGLAQGSPQRLHNIRRVLMSTVDDMWRPLDSTDSPHRVEPISIKKLRQGDAHWDTHKKILGWLIDSTAMTITLPPRRLQRLDQLLSSIPPTRKRLPLATWHQLLGELRSMALALPGARGLFSQLQHAASTEFRGRLKLRNGFHHALRDFRWLHHELASRPTRLYELVPTQPSLVGSHDASGRGAGGVIFPHPTTTSRLQPLLYLHNGRLQSTRPSMPVPVVWRYHFPSDITAQLISPTNPHGRINNSELELAGSFLHQHAMVSCFDVRERTTKSSTDNLATLFWNRRGSITTSSPTAYLLRLHALHQRFHRHVALHDFLPGDDNSLADDASRLHHLSHSDFLAYFNTHYPQDQPWHLWIPPPHVISAVTSALHKRMSKPASFLRAPAPPMPTGAPGPTSVPPSPSTPPCPTALIPSPSSKSLPADTVPAPSPRAANPSNLARWKMPYATLPKRLPVWGPQTLVSRSKVPWTSVSNAN